MEAPPDLTEEDVRILNIVNQQGMVRGSALMRRARLKRPNALRKAVAGLLKTGLIEASGNIHDDKEIRYAVFSTRPSKRQAVQHTLKKAL